MRTGPDLTGHLRGYEAAYDMPPGELPPEVPKSGLLKPTGGGRHESDQDVFTAHVAEDGSVEMEDAPSVEVAFIFPLPIIVGRFDATDIIMRAYGEDPYARRKLNFLNETREERVEIGRVYRAKQLAMTPQILRKNLERMFATKTDPAEQKQALFEMWDEAIDADEPGSASEEAVGAGLTARKLVIGAVLSHFPADSADAFTAAELAACNRKRMSKAAFAPYAD